MSSAVEAVWESLQREAASGLKTASRLYRALGMSAVGIRAGYLPGLGVRELLIEVPADWSADAVIPEWQGMQHEVVDLGLPPRKEAHHLRLSTTTLEHSQVFALLSNDLVASLEGVVNVVDRVREIEKCLLRWRRFFERAGQMGLSTGMQQGLFAELTWLQMLLKAGIHPNQAVSAWKGCERGYHDFDLDGHVVEVKSTRTKEPRSIIIANERQLDERGLQSLHLYALSLHEVEGGGASLPERVGTVRAELVDVPAALHVFEQKLVSAGYHDQDAARYVQRWMIKSEDLYRVVFGFPRIVDLPGGIGDLKYRLMLSSCEPFRADREEYLAELIRL